MRPGDQVRVNVSPASEYYRRVLRLSRHGVIRSLAKGPHGIELALVSIVYGTKLYPPTPYPVAELRGPRIDISARALEEEAAERIVAEERERKK